jgi:hypothetical protein
MTRSIRTIILARLAAMVPLLVLLFIIWIFLKQLITPTLVARHLGLLRPSEPALRLAGLLASDVLQMFGSVFYAIASGIAVFAGIEMSLVLGLALASRLLLSRADFELIKITEAEETWKYLRYAVPLSLGALALLLVTNIEAIRSLETLMCDICLPALVFAMIACLVLSISYEAHAGLARRLEALGLPAKRILRIACVRAANSAISLFVGAYITIWFIDRITRETSNAAIACANAWRIETASSSSIAIRGGEETWRTAQSFGSQLNSDAAQLLALAKETEKLHDALPHLLIIPLVASFVLFSSHVTLPLLSAERKRPLTWFAVGLVCAGSAEYFAHAIPLAAFGSDSSRAIWIARFVLIFALSLLFQFVGRLTLEGEILCPRCLTRMVGDATYCFRCGMRISFLKFKGPLPVIANRQTKELHLITCRHAPGIKPPNRLVVTSLTEAYHQDFDNCAHCLGGSTR